MSHHQSQGTYKHDRPAWRWQGRGTYDYLHGSDDAARYVAQCRQREAAKAASRIARHNYAAFNAQANVVQPLTDSARLALAAARIGRAA